MADIAITAANVLPGASGVKTIAGTAGGTVTAGMAVYKDTADANEYKPADAGAEASAVVAGIALNGASDGQPLDILTEGPITIGGTAVAGTVYCASETPGGIAPNVDLLAGDYISVIGVGISATQIQVKILNSGVTE